MGYINLRFIIGAITIFIGFMLIVSSVTPLVLDGEHLFGAVSIGGGVCAILLGFRIWHASKKNKA
jgi:threonine/homoserine/homoserine lactone efflux protein